MITYIYLSLFAQLTHQQNTWNDVRCSDKCRKAINVKPCMCEKPTIHRKIQSSDWPKWCCALWRYLIVNARLLSTKHHFRQSNPRVVDMSIWNRILETEAAMFLFTAAWVHCQSYSTILFAWQYKRDPFHTQCVKDTNHLAIKHILSLRKDIPVIYHYHSKLS